MRTRHVAGHKGTLVSVRDERLWRRPRHHSWSLGHWWWSGAPQIGVGAPSLDMTLSCSRRGRLRTRHVAGHKGTLVSMCDERLWRRPRHHSWSLGHWWWSGAPQIGVGAPSLDMTLSCSRRGRLRTRHVAGHKGTLVSMCDERLWRRPRHHSWSLDHW